MRVSWLLAPMIAALACDEPPPPTRGISLLADAAATPGSARCFARKAFVGDPKNSRRIDRFVVKGGDGAGGYCIGDSRVDVGCVGTRQCRHADKGVDLAFDSQDRVNRIRVHRFGRRPGIARRGPLWFTDTHIVLDKPVSWLPKDLPEPESKAFKQDPEFGRIEIWYYPGLEVEIEYDEKSVRVIGGLVVKKK